MEYKHWIYCVVVMVLFLIFIHIIFTIPASTPWLEAVWDAGDVLIFVGTMILGIGAIHLSIKSNDMNDRLLLLEEERTLPILSITNLMGGHVNISFNDESNVPSTVRVDLVGDITSVNGNYDFYWCITIPDSKLDKSKKIYTRTYDLNIKQVSGQPISNVLINHIILRGKMYTVGKEIALSFSVGTEEKIRFIFISNENFMDINLPNSVRGERNDMTFNLDFESSSKLDNITIRKYESSILTYNFFCEYGDKKIPIPNTDRLVSYNYDVQKKQV